MQKTHAVQQNHIRMLLIGAAFLLMGFVPTAAEASSKPTCTVTVKTEQGTTKVTKEGDVAVQDDADFTMTWKSRNAKDATLNGEDIDLSDHDKFTATTSTTYTFSFTNGSKKATCVVNIALTDAHASDVTSDSSKPKLKGTAEGMKKVHVSVYKGDKRVFDKKNVSVKKGKWTVKVAKPLKSGTYEIRVMGSGKGDTDVLDTATLTVTSTKRDNQEDNAQNDSDGVLLVTKLGFPPPATIPVGGTKAVGYLQIENTGKEAVHLTGFAVRQVGSASTNTILRLSTVDNQGGSQGTSDDHPFSGDTAIAPTDATIAPGVIMLFTIKATLDTNALAGDTLNFEVTSVKSNGDIHGSFPITGSNQTITL